jgi:hypothetical protein
MVVVVIGPAYAAEAASRAGKAMEVPRIDLLPGLTPLAAGSKRFETKGPRVHDQRAPKGVRS